MVYKYAYKNFDKETMARASIRNAPISLKKTVETLRAIRGKKVSSAINFLTRVIDKKAVVPYKRYYQEMGHKPGKGIDVGGYPVKISRILIKLLSNALINAQNNEINGDLYVISASARKGNTRYHAGRFPGRRMKSTNVEIIIGTRKNLSIRKKERNRFRREVIKK